MLDTLELSASISPRLAKAVETNAASLADGMAPRCDANEREAWENLTDSTLIEWGRNPAEIEDDGVVAPSIETIGRAFDIANALRRHGLPAPTRIVPTGDGGIAIQDDAVQGLVSIEISANGTVEYFRFSGFKLVERYEVFISRGIQ